MRRDVVAVLREMHANRVWWPDTWCGGRYNYTLDIADGNEDAVLHAGSIYGAMYVTNSPHPLRFLLTREH